MATVAKRRATTPAVHPVYMPWGAQLLLRLLRHLMGLPNLCVLLAAAAQRAGEHLAVASRKDKIDLFFKLYVEL